MLWRAQTLITVGPQVYVTKIDDKPATKKESNSRVPACDTAVHTDSSTRTNITNTNTIASGPLNSNTFSMML